MNATQTTIMPERMLIPDKSPLLLCWNCAAPLTTITISTSAARTCPQCQAITAYKDGIWRCLSPDQALSFQRFIREYEFIRDAESRGSNDAAYYLALPFEDLTGKLAQQWHIRALTFRSLERYVIAPLAARHRRALRILDLGAGNGWLSYRLSVLGHFPVAVDILTNNRDGLGAAAHYAAHLATMFPRVRADVAQLPFADDSFDLAIFNASFHYAVDYSDTLAEALRCTRREGSVAIADTPWYSSEHSGLEMVAEKQRHFRSKYGFASNSLHSLEFLTPARLQSMAIALDCKWSVIKPFYGLHWALRPLFAKLQRRRTPSKFRIFVAEVPA